MKRVISKRLSLVIVVTMLFVLLLNLFLQIENAQQSMERSARQTIDRMEEILKENDEDLARLSESLKEDYIIRAKAVAYMLVNHPDKELDPAEMLKLAELFQVDEISLFDETGTLYGGTHAEYIGYTFFDGEQISFFIPMLSDKTLTLCQDVTPNTACGYPMMYAAVWRDDGKGIVQVGIEPGRILEVLEKNDLKFIFSNLAVQEGTRVFAIDASDGTILGATQTQWIGRNADEIGLIITENQLESSVCRVDGVFGRSVFREYNGVVIGVVYESGTIYRGIARSMFLVLLYLIVAALLMIAAILGSIDHLVIENINTVNRDLQEITNGNLDTKINVTALPEFVSLSNQINRMTESLLNTSVKISRVLDASESQIGFFEYSSENKTVMVTRKVATILAISPDDMAKLCQDRTLFKNRIDEICSKPVERSKNVYSLPTETACYVKVETYIDGENTFGIVMDVTEEILEKVRLRHERDHDLLTQLYCRRAFYRHLSELFSEPEKLGKAAMLMLDLDGLKGINDSCGHAGGDKAIREAANLLSGIETERKLAARLSGDEFAVFLYGADSYEQLQRHIDALHRTMLSAEITVFDKNIPVRLSGGYVFYPEFEGNYTALLRMADQALYHSKGDGKSKFSAYHAQLESTEV